MTDTEALPLTVAALLKHLQDCPPEALVVDSEDRPILAVVSDPETVSLVSASPR